MRADHHLKVVIDTNVWISAALSAGGAPAAWVRQVLAHGAPVFSPATFDELTTRLWRPKFDRYLSMETRQRLLHDLKGAALWVDIPAALTNLTWSRDAQDDVFIRTALAAQVPWLVSGDNDLLSVPAIAGLHILTPATALALPEFGNPH